MKKIIFFVAVISVQNLSQSRIVNKASFFSDLLINEWKEFKAHHNKTYKSVDEEKQKLKIFLENKSKVADHNTKYHKGLVSYKLGLNEYSDMLHNEILKTLNGFTQSTDSKSQLEPIGNKFIPPANVVFPNSVDWRNEGAVTPVKNQGQCGSCWAFSVTGALEGQHFRHTGKLVSLSEQNLVDCTLNDGNLGCDGGLMSISFDYIRKSGGIDTEESYPYEAKVNDKCLFKRDQIGATEQSFTEIAEGKEDDLLAAVATIGPIAVAMDASSESFSLYNSGVYHEPDCSSTNLDHAVLVVGYGETKKGEKYWLIKNSYGVTWGEMGYMRLARNSNNLCGIATYARYPNV